MAGESQRLSGMISELLDPIPDRGRQENWRLETLDLGEVVRQALKTNCPLFRDEGLALALKALDGKAQVLADQDKIVQGG
jgi:signal transduction histidine kinase